MSVNRPLTSQQQLVYDFIRDKIVTRGYGPTVREIGEHMNIKSPNGVMCHLRALERKGMIVRKANKSRAIELTQSIARLPEQSLPVAGFVQQASCLMEPSDDVDITALMSAQEGRFGLRVQDDSLQDIDIRRGDLLLVDVECDFVSGQLAIVRLPNPSGESVSMLRYIHAQASGYRIQAISQSVPPVESSKVDVEGVVVGVLRDLRARV